MEDILNRYVEKGLSSCFAISRTGDIAVSRDAGKKKDQFMQMALVVFETISAIGEIKIDQMEIRGESRGLIMHLGEETLLGSLFENRDGVVVEELWTLLGEIAKRPTPATGERKQARLETAILDKIKVIMADYLGDFTERIYNNQLKSHGISSQVEELSPKDVRLLVATLTKAASMIIGPTKSRDMRNKLLELLI
jgi:hypothetical protein